MRDTLALRDKYCPQAKVCLLTNATHLNREDVFEAVRLIDRPCLKLDTVDADYIRLVDRPNARYDVKEVIERIKELNGRCIVQTMFMQGTFAGQSVDNTTEKYVGPGLKRWRRFVPKALTSILWRARRLWRGLKRRLRRRSKGLRSGSRTWASALTGTDKESRLVGVVCQKKRFFDGAGFFIVSFCRLHRR